MGVGRIAKEEHRGVVNSREKEEIEHMKKENEEREGRKRREKTEKAYACGKEIERDV